MAKKAYIYMNYPNVVVLNVYLDVIKEALARLNFQCEYIKDFEGVSKQDLIVFPMERMLSNIISKAIEILYYGSKELLVQNHI